MLQDMKNIYYYTKNVFEDIESICKNKICLKTWEKLEDIKKMSCADKYFSCPPNYFTRVWYRYSLKNIFTYVIQNIFLSSRILFMT